jgi:hypothetical protein
MSTGLRWRYLDGGLDGTAQSLNSLWNGQAQWASLPNSGGNPSPGDGNVVSTPSQNAAITASTSVESTNWSGAAITAGSGESFSTVSAQWVVPTITQVPISGVTTSDIAEWVGIDGYNSSDVCQAGVMQIAQTTNGQTTTSCQAWVEWYPADAIMIPLSSFDVSPGNTITVTVETSGAGATTAEFIFDDVTTGQTYETTLTAPNGTSLQGNSAEYVVETPEWISGNQVSQPILSDFLNTPVVFSDARATYSNGSAASLSSSSAVSIDMETNDVPGTSGYVQEAYGSIQPASNSVTVTENDYWGGPAPPVVTATNQTAAAGQSIPLSNIYSVSGSGITEYEIWFSWPEGGDPAYGSVTDNGTPIADDQWVTVSSLSGLDFVGSATPGTDDIWLKAYNGQWSSSVQATITDSGMSGASALSSNVEDGTLVSDPLLTSGNAGSSTLAGGWSLAASDGSQAFNWNPGADFPGTSPDSLQPQGCNWTPGANSSATAPDSLQPQGFWNQALTDHAQWMFQPAGSGQEAMANFGEHDSFSPASFEPNTALSAGLLNNQPHS